MQTTRRRVVAAAASLPVFAITGRAEAATFKYRCATNLPTTHPLNIRLNEAARRIKAQSGGRLLITVFPNSELGGDTVMLSEIRSGAVQFFTLSGLILSTLVPVAALSGVGFAFKDYTQVWAAMDGQVGALIRQSIAKHGLIALPRAFDNGFREITTSTRPIRIPADLKGLTIRVPVAPLWTSMFKDFGALPTSINFNEVYTALQTHVADAEENPLAVIATAKLYEVQKYCSLTNHMWDGFWFLANPAAFKRLPPDLQALVTKEIDAAALAERKDVVALNNSLRSKLSDQGMIFNATDPAQFREALRRAGFYAEWRQRFGQHAWDTLETVTGKLA